MHPRTPSSLQLKFKVKRYMGKPTMRWSSQELEKIPGMKFMRECRRGI
jgi:hypothetical protein